MQLDESYPGGSHHFFFSVDSQKCPVKAGVVHPMTRKKSFAATRMDGASKDAAGVAGASRRGGRPGAAVGWAYEPGEGELMDDGERRVRVGLGREVTRAASSEAGSTHRSKHGGACEF